MILALRGLISLLVKDLWHHALALAAGGVLYGALFIAFFANAMNTSDDSLLATATNTAYYVGPGLAAWVMRRLIVLEREDGSAAFLAALPVAPGRVWAARFGLGLAVTWAIALPFVPLTALVVQNREIVPFLWAVTVTVQTALVLAAWVAICAVIGQLGRRRSAVWVALLVGLLTLDEATDARAYATWTWHAALATPLSWTRQATPWAAMATTAAWAIGATALSATLATWRHGATVDALWRRSGATVRDAVLLVSVNLFVLDVFDPWIDAEPDRWGHARAIAGSVRTTADVGSGAEQGAVALAAELEELGAWLGDDAWPTVVVVPRHPGDGPLPHSDDEVVVRMSGVTDLAPALRDVLIARTGGRLERDEALHWLRDGLPAAFVARHQGWADPASVGLAALAPRGQDAARWPAYAVAVGPAAAEAVACVGVRALILSHGPEAARAGLSAALLRGTPPPTPDPGSWDAAVGTAPTALPAASFARGDAFGVPVRLDWRATGPLPDGATLVWAALSPLRTLPEDVAAVPITGASGQVPLMADPERAVWAAIEVPTPAGRLRVGSAVVRP